MNVRSRALMGMLLLGACSGAPEQAESATAGGSADGAATTGAPPLATHSAGADTMTAHAGVHEAEAIDSAASDLENTAVAAGHHVAEPAGTAGSPEGPEAAEKLLEGLAPGATGTP